jgi:predicted DNA-binding mobile mystery protein A
MTQEDLAQRMGVSRQAVSQLEQRELDGSVTLKALRHAAEALGSQVAYAVVPQQSIQKTLEERAYVIARRMVASVRHSMRLENQEPESDIEARVREVAEELLAKPGALFWSHPDAG